MSIRQHSNSLSRRIAAWLVVAVIALQPSGTLVVANPENPEVRHGDVEFNFDNPGELFIDQFSDKAIIDWESFSIDSGELTRFIQPSSSSAALSRVFSGAPSEIHGQLEANGQIFLINPNGILVGPSGTIDTAGFLGSTLDVSDAEFMNGGDMVFSGGSGASVVNLGTINAIDGGDIFLIAKNVVNEGSLHAPEGTVGLAAGQEVRVAAAGEERVTIAPGGEGSVTNKGQIQAMTAELKAAGGNQYALAINNEGMVRAKSFETRGGRLYLSAGGGRIVNTGSAQASKSVSVSNTSLNGSAEIGGIVRAQDEETGNGGEVAIAAPNVEVLAGGRVDASGVEAGSVAIRATVIGGAANVSGDVRASSDAGVGGVVSVTGETIEVGSTGSIRADGATEGGLVTLGVNPVARTSRSEVNGTTTDLEVHSTSITTAAGSKISANGSAGAGGDVLLFADTTESEMRLGGEIRANGGGVHGGEVLALGHDVRVEQSALIRANGETDGGLIRVEGEGDVVVAGKMQAKGTQGDGGFVHVSGENVTFTETSEVDARGGRDGGFIEVEGGEDGAVSIAGQLLASGGRDGGMIAVTGGDVTVTQTGLLDASGDRDGGFVSVDGSGDVHVGGRILAMGGEGDGGVISVTGENVTVAQSGLLDASGGNNGGVITVEAENDASFNGTARAVGGTGDGGVVEVLGENVSLGSTALIDASGAVNGGNVFVGGGRAGRDPERRNARNTTVANGARILANGGEAGGSVVLWADGAQDFQGSIESSGSRQTFDEAGRPNEILANSATTGGFVEVSGLEHLNFAGHVNTGGGQLLLDPFNYTIDAAAAGAIVAALAGNNVTIDTTMDVGGHGSSGNAADTGIITVNADIFYDSTNDLTFLARSDAIFNASVQNRNATGGDINVVAGWDGTTAFDAATFLAADVSATTIYGQSLGSMAIGDGALPSIAVGSRAGATNVLAHDLSVQSGSGFAQLGFAVTNGVALDGTLLGGGTILTGPINVRARNDINVVSSATPLAYAQIGHVGDDIGNLLPDANTNSDIHIVAGRDVTLSNNGGINSSTIVGHGGPSAAGDFAGRIQLEARNLSLTSGPSLLSQFANTQLGHGAATGNSSGDIDLDLSGDLSLLSHPTSQSYAQIGHFSRDDTGDISVRVDGNLTLTGGDDTLFGGVPSTFIGHGRVKEGDISVAVSGDADLIDAGGRAGIRHQGVGDSGGFGHTHLGVGGTLTAAAGSEFGSAQSAAAGGELRIYLLDPANDFVHSNAALNGVPHGLAQAPNLQSPHRFGTGPYPAGAPFAYYPLAGFNYLISAPEAAAIVTALNGGDVAIDRNLYQPDFGAVLDWDGDTQSIQVFSDLLYDSVNDLSFLTTGNVNFYASVQNRNATSGAINVVAGWDGTTAFDEATFKAADPLTTTIFGANGGSVIMNSAPSATIIGSRSDDTNVFTDHLILAADSDLKVSQLGFRVQNGLAAGGAYLGVAPAVSGDITVRSRGDIRLDPLRSRTYAQIGHIGADFSASNRTVEAIVNSDIDLTIGGSLIILGGSNTGFSQFRYAQVGHGGGFTDVDIDGAITINRVEDINILGGVLVQSHAQLGHGGAGSYGSHSGNIRILDANTIQLDEMDRRFTSGYRILGHVGSESHTGDIEITHRGDLNLFGALNHITLIGNLGDIEAGGNIQIQTGGDFTANFAQVGNFGRMKASGDIQIESSGALGLDRALIGSQSPVEASGIIQVQTAGTLVANNDSWVGHYDRDSGSATLSGDITLDVGGNVEGNGAWFGHVTSVGLSNTGDLQLRSGGDIAINLAIFGGSYDTTSAYSYLAEGDVTFRAPVQNRNATGGAINVVAGWDGTTAFDAATFLAADVNATTLYGQNMGSVNIGDGTQAAGVAVGARSGNSTNVFGYDVNVHGGNGAGDGRFAQLGYQVSDGGAATTIDGEIRVRARNDVSAAAGDTGQFNYAQIGHVGADQTVDFTTDEAMVDAAIDVAAGGDLNFTGGGGSYSSAQLGHGGNLARGAFGGSITVHEAGDLNFLSGGADSSYAQLGHGGVNAAGNRSGAITISMANDVTFHGGAGDFATVQLGHGGYAAAGDHSGDITLTRVNNLDFRSGIGSEIAAQLGHGGVFSGGNHSGAISVTADGNLTLTGFNPIDAFSAIGHGDSPGDGDAGESAQGDVMVRVGGNATLTDAAIGHLVDPDGTYADGKTFIGVGLADFTPGSMATLNANARSRFASAPAAAGGELRFYLPNQDANRIAQDAPLNGTPAPNPARRNLPNLQGPFDFGLGPYDVEHGTNFAFYAPTVPIGGESLTRERRGVANLDELGVVLPIELSDPTNPNPAAAGGGEMTIPAAGDLTEFERIRPVEEKLGLEPENGGANSENPELDGDANLIPEPGNVLTRNSSEVGDEEEEDEDEEEE